MKFSIIGFIPTLLLLIPVIFACFKTPADKPELEDENIVVFIAKCVGRFGCIGYMCLCIGSYKVGFSSKLLFIIWAAIMLIVIALYWVLWARQYKRAIILKIFTAPVSRFSLYRRQLCSLRVSSQ